MDATKRSAAYNYAEGMFLYIQNNNFPKSDNALSN